jgi:hypothetical protein
MKITNTLLLLAVAASMTACEKQTDTATPADATPEAPATDDMTAEPPAEDDMLGGEEAAPEEPAAAEEEEAAAPEAAE